MDRVVSVHPRLDSSFSKISWSVSCGKWSWSCRSVTSGDSVSADSAAAPVGSNENAAKASGGNGFVPVLAAMEKGELEGEG